MTTAKKSFLVLLLSVLTCATTPAQQPPTLQAKTYNSGFPQAHDSYNAIGFASDGKLYYVLSSENYATAGQMYSFDPATKKIRTSAISLKSAVKKEPIRSRKARATSASSNPTASSTSPPTSATITPPAESKNAASHLPAISPTPAATCSLIRSPPAAFKTSSKPRATKASSP